MNSVTALHIYPIITPQITSIDMRFIRRLASITKNIQAREPANAAVIMPAEFIVAERLRSMTIQTATVSFAPDEIPRTNGPASGL